MGHLRRDSAKRRDLFAVGELLIGHHQSSLFAIHDTQQNADDDHIDRHRDEEMFNSLLDLVTVVRVFGTGIIALNPTVVRRPQHSLPRYDYGRRQYDRQRSKEEDQTEIGASRFRQYERTWDIREHS